MLALGALADVFQYCFLSMGWWHSPMAYISVHLFLYSEAIWFLGNYQKRLLLNWTRARLFRINMSTWWFLLCIREGIWIKGFTRKLCWWSCGGEFGRHLFVWSVQWTFKPQLLHMFVAAKFSPVKRLKVWQKFTCESFSDEKQSRHSHVVSVISFVAVTSRY